MNEAQFVEQMTRLRGGNTNRSLNQRMPWFLKRILRQNGAGDSYIKNVRDIWQRMHNAQFQQVRKNKARFKSGQKGVHSIDREEMERLDKYFHEAGLTLQSSAADLIDRGHQAFQGQFGSVSQDSLSFREYLQRRGYKHGPSAIATLSNIHAEKGKGTGPTARRRGRKRIGSSAQGSVQTSAGHQVSSIETDVMPSQPTSSGHPPSSGYPSSSDQPQAAYHPIMPPLHVPVQHPLPHPAHPYSFTDLLRGYTWERHSPT